MSDTFFNLNSIRPEPIQQHDFSVSHKFIKTHESKVESLKQLVGKLPGDGEAFFIETEKSFNAFTFIVYLLKYVGDIDELYVATYGLNARIIHSITGYMNKGRIKRVHIHISESIKARLPKIADMLQAVCLSNSNFSLSYAWTHKKVMCVRVGDEFFVIEGSGNWSENSAQEQYVFIKSQKIYEFRKRTIG